MRGSCLLSPTTSPAGLRRSWRRWRTTSAYHPMCTTSTSTSTLQLTPRCVHVHRAYPMHLHCHAHATHTPRTRHARATHAPRTRHAHAMHTPCSRHAHAMLTPCTLACTLACTCHSAHGVSMACSSGEAAPATVTICIQPATICIQPVTICIQPATVYIQPATICIQEKRGLHWWGRDNVVPRDRAVPRRGGTPTPNASGAEVSDETRHTLRRLMAASVRCMHGACMVHAWCMHGGRGAPANPTASHYTYAYPEPGAESGRAATRILQAGGACTVAEDECGTGSDPWRGLGRLTRYCRARATVT